MPDGTLPHLSTPARARPTRGAARGSFVVNEVQTSGPAGAEDEWVELFNPQSCAGGHLGLGAQAHVDQRDLDRDRVHRHGRNEARGRGLRRHRRDDVQRVSADDRELHHGGARRHRGGLGFYNAADVLVDSMGYGAGASNPFVETAPAPAGVTSESIARIPNGTETDDNATDFKIATTPTPGAAN